MSEKLDPDPDLRHKSKLRDVAAKNGAMEACACNGPDPSFHFKADPTFHFNADSHPDPAPQ